MVKVDLPSVVGSGYGKFWNWNGRYLVCKGGRGSKKSTTAALKIIYLLMKYPQMNALVVRRYYAGLKDSCFAQLVWATNRLGVAHLWRYTRSPLQMLYKPTGQVILFRGMDDPQSVTSITVPTGSLNICYIEETYQITDEESFNKLDLSIRGEGAPFKQIIMTFNPWNEHHWLKRRFFDTPDPDVLAMTTDYRCNEWLGEDDRALFEKMKNRWPRRYQVEGLGDWGVSDGLIYTDWETKHVDRDYLLHSMYNGEPRVRAMYGMDFGFAQDPTAAVEVLVDARNSVIYISDEIYEHGLTNEAMAIAIREHGWASQRITADSAEPRTINELYRLGVERIVGATKGPDSIRAGIQRLQDYHIIVDPRCVNVIRELSNYQWKTDRYDGHTLPRPLENGFDHAMDALRYATESLTGPTFSFSKNRETAGGYEFM